MPCRSSLALALFAAALLACPADGAPPLEPPPGPVGWHTEGRHVVDVAGRTTILHGINLSNDVKQPPFDSWTEAEDYARLQSWGMNALRLLTGWAAIMPTEGEIDADYLARYEARLDLAEEHGLLVIVDMHQDVFGLGFGGNGAPEWACDPELYDAFEPTSPWYLAYFDPAVQACYDRFWTDPALQARYVEAFVAVAELVTERDHVVGFDLMNEPHWGTADLDTFHRERLQPLYEDVIAAVSEVAPGKLFFVEAATTVQYGLQPALAPFPQGEIVYAPHYYDRGVHDEHVWDGRDAVVESVFETYAETATMLDGPWLLGEYGGFTDSTDFDLYLRLILGLLEEHHAGSTYWTYDVGTGGFGPLNDDHSDKDHVVDVLARVYPRATAGALLEYRFDDVARTFTMTFAETDGLTPEVVLAIPDRHFYDAPVVDCGGCAVVYDPALRELTATFTTGAGPFELSLD